MTNQRGVVTRRDEEVTLSDDQELVASFTVVDDAASIHFTLLASVEV